MADLDTFAPEVRRCPFPAIESTYCNYAFYQLCLSLFTQTLIVILGSKHVKKTSWKQTCLGQQVDTRRDMAEAVHGIIFIVGRMLMD